MIAPAMLAAPRVKGTTTCGHDAGGAYGMDAAYEEGSSKAISARSGHLFCPCRLFETIRMINSTLTIDNSAFNLPLHHPGVWVS